MRDRRESVGSREYISTSDSEEMNINGEGMGKVGTALVKAMQNREKVQMRLYTT